MQERIITLQSAAAANGNGTVAMCEQQGLCSVQVVGTFSATINFEVTIDNTNWVSVLAKNESTGVVGTTATAAGIYTCVIAGFLALRARVSGYASGSVTVTAKLIDFAPNAYTTLGQAVVSDHLVTIDWPHNRIHDGQHWTYTFSNSVTNTNEQTVIAFNAPATNEVHVIFEVQSTHQANAYLYRDTSIDVDEGTQATPVNRNQTGTPAACTLTSIETTPVAGKVTTYNETQAASANITTTSLLDTVYLNGGEGPKAVGAEFRDEEEWVFSGSTQVAIVLNAGTIDDAVHLIRIEFYEE